MTKFLPLILVASSFFFSCASPVALTKSLNTFLSQNQYAQATALIEKSKLKNYGKKNALLYYLDHGMMLHMEGRYEESNQSFAQAKSIAEEHFTKSVSKEAGTFLVSDNFRPYYGEDFERALIHVFSALNYLFLKKEDNALVEARQVDFLLTKLQTDYGHKNKYKEDAFARYLAGMIYENAGEINNAYISYYKALAAYDTYKRNYKVKAPPFLIRSALLTAKNLGFNDRVQQIQKQWGGKVPKPLPKNSGEIIVLHYNGLPPHKTDIFFEISFGKAWGYAKKNQPKGEDQKKYSQASAIARSIAADKIVRVAFPKYKKTPYKIIKMELQAEGAKRKHKAYLAEDIGAIAIKNLKDRIKRTRAKAIARAAIKFSLTQKIAKKVENKQGQGLAWLTKKVLQVASTATELADKRFWQTIPDKIYISRIVLPKGQHTLHLTFKDKEGNVVSTQDIDGVQVSPHQKKLLIVRTAQ